MYFNSNTEIAVKVFDSTDDGSQILRDITIGFNEKLVSEYTLNYKDEFIAESDPKEENSSLRGSKNFQCVVMDLMDGSLRDFLLKQNGLLSDDV
jgi:hypothetical protein